MPICSPGPYRYMVNLCRLHAAIPQQGLPSIPAAMHINSPLLPCLTAWQDGLRNHPDRWFAKYVTRGIQHGFRVGFDYSFPLRPTRRNMPSAAAHPDVINKYVGDEIASGRIFGPFHKRGIPNLQINCMGVVPKGHSPGR